MQGVKLTEEQARVVARVLDLMDGDRDHRATIDSLTLAIAQRAHSVLSRRGQVFGERSTATAAMQVAIRDLLEEGRT